MPPGAERSLGILAQGANVEGDSAFRCNMFPSGLVILTYCWWLKSGNNPLEVGSFSHFFLMVSYLLGAGIQPSTVRFEKFPIDLDMSGVPWMGTILVESTLMQFYGSFCWVILCSFWILNADLWAHFFNQTNRRFGNFPWNAGEADPGFVFAKGLDHSGLGSIAVCPDSRTCNQNANHPWTCYNCSGRGNCAVWPSK